MKFTNGYWMLRDEMTPAYAVEYGSHMVKGDELTVYLPGKHIAGRGDALNIPMLTITLSTPLEGVIKVSAVHHAGALYKGPFAEIKNEHPRAEITETEECLTFASGSLRAVIDKTPNAYKLAFYEGDKFLTESSFRNLAHMHNRETGKNYMVEQLLIDVDEYVYGLGERFTPFVKNGQTVEMWNEDGGTASEIAYKNIPFYITNKGYGVLVGNEGDVAYEIASEKVERIQFSVEGERLDYYFISGKSPMGTVEKYTELTGKPALPPAWSFGLWLTTSFTTDYDENTTSGFVQGMADRDIPLHVFHFDCYWMEAFEWCNFKWDPNVTTDPKSMLQRYHDKGLKICVWINPYIGQKSCLFEEGREKGYLLKRTDGSVWQTDLWQPGMGLVDFTNPDACAWYQSKLKTLLDMGVDCFKTDFGERVPVKDIVYFDGSDPVKMHNYYTYLYNQTVFQLLEEERGKGEAVLFARSATVGGQKFPAHWGGDCSATYVSMAETLRGGLSLSLSGFGFWSHDISGFEQTAPADIYKRWCQFGLLSSHSRLHGSSSYRVPWLFDDEACVILKEFVNLKCRLMPYLYGQAVRSHEYGTPVLRPMFLDFPEDRACDTLDRQYMFGSSLLAAPVFKESGEVDYYLPKGTWVNLITGETREGGTWYKETHDYHSLPLMVKENTILPMGNNDREPEYDFADGVTLLLSVFADGKEADVEIPDCRGNVVMKAHAVCRDGEISVHVEGGNGNYTVKSLAGQIVKMI
ncbi:alpha-xylosidase [Blautia producta]|uniref:alpha-D-xyloside xylohydrolase n=2 Tax=Blautia producta TaxID=33035 RepID=A0A7G5MZW9_9FIRM|nr:alpha-xylosidase [Blautia producta]QIB57061.1 alpha-xylosidase [Blautia producta ATCC 27340 = DSM 2950]QMW80162.1 alpha-xylosidase [Blautia producta]